MKKKNKRKYKPYVVFCCVENKNWQDTFRIFTKKTREIFQEPKSQDLFSEIIKSDAYLFILDMPVYQSIQSKLDEHYQDKKIKPLIYIVGDISFSELGSISDWVGYWGLEPKDDTLRKVNISRSRIRSNHVGNPNYR